jgi:SAM-dependent methyltransferase
MAAPAKRWNHNLHYHPLILDAVPGGCQRALDVGCGEGILARQLRRIVPHVTAIDLHQPSIRLARQHHAAADIDYVVGNFLTYPFEPASFDLIASVAALHHMDAAAALERMRMLLRPGGKVVVVGLARSRHPADLPRDVAAVLASRLHRAAKGYWEISAPTLWPPPETYAGMRRLAAEVLPGVRYRRHLLWRYSLVWTKPPP